MPRAKLILSPKTLELLIELVETELEYTEGTDEKLEGLQRSLVELKEGVWID